MCEMACQIVQKNLEEKQLEEEQTVKAQSWKLPVCYDDDDDEEGYNSLNDNIISELPPYSAKIDSLFDEFAGELTLLKSIPSGIDETDCHPEEEIRLAKRLFDSHMEEIDLPFTPDDPMSSDIEDDDYDSERDIPILEEFLDNYSLSLPANESYHFDIPSPYRPPAKPPDGTTGTLNIKMMGDVSDQKDSDSHMEEIDLSFNPDDKMPLGIEDDDYDSRRDIPILEELLDNYFLSLPNTESYRFDIPSPYRPHTKPPDGNTGTLNIKMMGDVSNRKVPIPNLAITRVLNHKKSPDLLSHLGFEAFQPSAECPMIISGKNIPLLDVPLFHFYPP
nr:hypothetical protein [Tanacetum cinerariifolium]